MTVTTTEREVILDGDERAISILVTHEDVTITDGSTDAPLDPPAVRLGVQPPP